MWPILVNDSHACMIAHAPRPSITTAKFLIMQEIRMNNNVTKVMEISNAVFTAFTAFWGEHCVRPLCVTIICAYVMFM